MFGVHSSLKVLMDLVISNLGFAEMVWNNLYFVQRNKTFPLKYTSCKLSMQSHGWSSQAALLSLQVKTSQSTQSGRHVLNLAKGRHNDWPYA